MCCILFMLLVLKESKYVSNNFPLGGDIFEISRLLLFYKILGEIDLCKKNGFV